MKSKEGSDNEHCCVLMKELIARVLGFWHTDEYANEMFRCIPKQWYRLYTSNQLLYCLRQYYETGNVVLIKSIGPFVDDRYEWNASKGYWVL